MFKIGIIGYGTVGMAVGNTFKKKYELVTYDKFKDLNSFDELLSCKLIFVTVPTPFDEVAGSVDISAVDESFERLKNYNYSGVVVLKSTVPPGVSRGYSHSNPAMRVYFNPEFLREETANFDFENQTNIVIGSDLSSADDGDLKLVKSIFLETVNNSSNAVISVVNYELAELVKYSQNVMFASRVSVCNIIYDACREHGVRYDSLKELAFANEPLIGGHVVSVPGPDGMRGFGGKCLPKDLAGFNSFYKNDIFSAMLNYNKKLGRIIE